MTKTIARLAAALSEAWNANGASTAFAAPTMQRKALNAKKNVKPLSPIVINFELAAWLMRVLSDGHNSNNHSPGGNDLIEINLADLASPAPGPANDRQRLCKGYQSLANVIVAKSGIKVRWSVSDRGSDLHFAAGAIRKRLENIPACDDACQSMVAVHCRNAPDPMIDHELEHAREFGVGSNVDEFGSHDIGDRPVHQLLIMWNHLTRRKDKTFQQIKLGHDADHLRVVFDRIGVEIVALEHVAEIAHRELARHRPDSLRHVAGNGFFEKFVQGAILSIVAVSAFTSNATAIRNAWIG